MSSFDNKLRNQFPAIGVCLNDITPFGKLWKVDFSFTVKPFNGFPCCGHNKGIRVFALDDRKSMLRMEWRISA